MCIVEINYLLLIQLFQSKESRIFKYVAICNRNTGYLADRELLELENGQDLFRD